MPKVRPVKSGWISRFMPNGKKTVPTYQQVSGVQNRISTEAAPNVNFERYNYDRMFVFVRNFDFRDQTILDIGCNAGWFCHEIALMGAKLVVGIDYDNHPEMGGNLRHASLRARRDKLPIKYFDFRITSDNLEDFPINILNHSFDYLLLLSVLHHIPNSIAFVKFVSKFVKKTVIYEDHMLWSELYNHEGKRLQVGGDDTYRFGWNDDISWIDEIGSVNFHSKIVLEKFRDHPIVLLLKSEGFTQTKFLGFSEKRRPILSFSRPEVKLNH